MIPLINHCHCGPEHAIFTSCLGLNDCLECQLYKYFAKFVIPVKWHGDAPCAKEPKTYFASEQDRVTNSAGVLQILQKPANAVLIRLGPKVILRHTLATAPALHYSSPADLQLCSHKIEWGFQDPRH